MQTRYLVLACKDMIGQFYRVGQVIADTTDRPTADRAFMETPKAPTERVVLFRFAADCPDGKELSCRH